MANNDDVDAIDNTNNILLLLLLVVLLQQQHHQPLVPLNQGWTGQEVVDDLLSCNNSTQIHNQLHMQLDTFIQLQNWLVNNTRLNSSQNVLVEEKLLIFIYITSSGVSNQAA